MALFTLSKAKLSVWALTPWRGGDVEHFADLPGAPDGTAGDISLACHEGKNG